MFYKVVRKFKDRYVSSVAYGRWQLEYRIGEPTRSKSGIFIFSDLKQSKDYLEYLTASDRIFDIVTEPYLMIFEVDAKNYWVPDYICSSYEEELLNAYYSGWEESINTLRMISPWSSLVLAEQITPIREIPGE